MKRIPKKETMSETRQLILEAERLRRRLKQMPDEPRSQEWEALAKVWPRLSARVQAGILVLAGVARAHRVPLQRRTRSRRGETPDWFQEALTILQDAQGRITDREISRRLGLAQSTLSRSEEFQRARETFVRIRLSGGARKKERGSEAPPATEEA